ncbi:transmembrane channel-like protein 8 isoform X5 [Pteropus alecto]|uniref:transmembrane channel-like protein 8 isoform X5 n=1 Tax=Pteropus alecto TaxID=9402 RepID=UPI000D53460E|nr:transmembrane channel-like protein 8 isoform X5 [Pteropus alecto]
MPRQRPRLGGSGCPVSEPSPHALQDPPPLQQEGRVGTAERWGRGAFCPLPDLGKWPEVGPMARSPILSLELQSLGTLPPKPGTTPLPTRRRAGVRMGGGGPRSSVATAWAAGCLPWGWGLAWAHLGAGTWALPRTYFQLLPGALAPYSRLGQVGPAWSKGAGCRGSPPGACSLVPRAKTLRLAQQAPRSPRPPAEMLRQWSVQSGQAPGEPGEPAGEELWESEMERLCSSQAPVRTLPYAMVDRRFLRQLREPEGVKTPYWRRWRRRGRTAKRSLEETAQQLAQGFGLWEGALYEIGGLFGTGIQSYFTFLRFLLLLNLLTLLLTSGSVLLPLVWLRPPDPGPALNFTLWCPGGTQPQTGVPSFHNQLWNVLTGRAFSNTYLFYGAYRAGPEDGSAYSIRLAYLLSPLACLLLCFCGTLQRMVKGLPQKLFLGQHYRTPLSAKVFSSWDFCIQGKEASSIKKHEISNEFKVELEEGRRFLQVQQQTRAQRACHLLTYLRVNFLIGVLVVAAISAIFWATKYSQDNKEEALFVLLQYLPPGVISLVNFLGPLLFTFLVQLENYSPNTEVNLTLMWCVVLKLASLGMFSFSLGQTILCIGRNNTSCEPYGYNACDYQCWENAVGEELYRLSIFNFLLTVAFAFFVSLPRKLLVERFSGRFWAWLDREEFLVPKNVLDIVAGQTITWMGLFYCPLLPLLNSIFIFLTFYIKKYTLLKNSKVSPRRFRASSSTFFFQLVLILGLLLATVPLGYVVSSLVLTVCVSQSQANARAIQGLRKQLVWQVQEKWHLVEHLSRLLPESPHALSPRPRSFCPGSPCPGSPASRPPRPGRPLADPTCRFRFPSGADQ